MTTPPGIPVVNAQFEFPTTRVIRRHSPPPGGYGLYRACLRIDFEHACGYCTSHECQVGRTLPYGGFEIDHFKPQVPYTDLVNRYDNLIWSCPTCNRAKKHKWPSKEEQALGFRFVNPCVEALAEHLEFVGTQVQAKTTAGEYMIDSLNLNGAAQIERRREHHELVLKFEKLESLLSARRAEGVQNTEEAAEIAEALSALRKVVMREKPWDAPTSCRCDSRRRRRPVASRTP